MSDNEKKKLNPVFIIVREVLAIVLWLFLYIKVVIFDVDVYFVEEYCPQFNWLIKYKFFIFIAIISVLWLLLKKNIFNRLAVYILLYPFIVIFWKIPKMLFHNWPVAAVFFIAIYDLARSLKFLFVTTAIALISGFAILISQETVLIVPAMSFLGVYLIMHLIQKFQKAYGSNLFEGITKFVYTIGDKIDNGSFFVFEEEENVENEKSEKQRKTNIQKYSGIYMSNWFFEFAADKLHDIAKSRKIDLYLMISLSYTVFITALIFAFEYFGLYKVIPGSFSQSGLGFWDFFGYSFSVLTTSGVSTVKSTFWITMIFSYLEVVCAWLILVMLVFTILTAAREKYVDDISSFISALRATAGKVENKLLEKYKKSINEIEIILIETDEKFVNMLRKTRGMQAITAPSKEEKQKEN